MRTDSIDNTIGSLVDLSISLEGHLRKREVQFLASLPFIKTPGEILEIGSFKGKSTIVLAKSAQAAGMKKIVACDPLSQACETDPTDATGEELPDIFYSNLTRFHVAAMVQFHQVKSEALARTWTAPLKALWIDGDHTYAGAMADISLFETHLTTGAIVCFHDVLHGFEGPVRTFIEKILLSGSYGECGLCGSIGWGQFLGNRAATPSQWKNKLMLYTRLSRLVPFVIRKNQGMKTSDFMRRFYRSRIPHGPIDPESWINKMNAGHG